MATTQPWPRRDALERVVAATNRTFADPAALDAVATTLANLHRLEDVTSAAYVLPKVRQQAAVAARIVANSRAHLRPAAIGLLSELEQYLGWLFIPLRRWAIAKIPRPAPFVLHALGDESAARHAASESLPAMPTHRQKAQWAGARRTLTDPREKLHRRVESDAA